MHCARCHPAIINICRNSDNGAAELLKTGHRVAAARGVASRVTFELADIFEFDLSGATVVYLYMLPAALGRLSDKLESFLQQGAASGACD